MFFCVHPFRICVPERDMLEVRYMEFVDRLCRRSATFLTKFAIFAEWQSPYRNIYLCRFILRFSAFLSGMLTKYLLNARFQNSDFVFRQLKPGIIFVRLCRKEMLENLAKFRGQRYIIFVWATGYVPKVANNKK